MKKNFTSSSISVRASVILKRSLILFFVLSFVCNVHAGSSLPVYSTPISISPVGQNLVISFQAAKDEFNYYEVQKSDDGQNFRTIGLVLDAPENSNTCLFKDKTPAAACKTIWYRIKAIDNSGAASFSNSTMFECIKAESAVTTSAYPNPSYGGTTLKINSTEAGFARISIQDLQGKVWLSKQSEIIKGENNINLDELKSLNRGIYIARLVINGSMTGSQKLIRN